MKHTDTIALQGSIADMRQRIATEQSGMHKVRLGVARWSNAAAPQEADARPSPASQTRWHAEAQCHFMCWLELGGFAHAQAEFDSQAASATAVGPHDHEALAKGALAQAKPSVTPISPAQCHDCTA